VTRQPRHATPPAGDLDLDRLVGEAAGGRALLDAAIRGGLRAAGCTEMSYPGRKF
jgi:hypothetical protein